MSGKTKYFIIDTSAILSGKPIIFENAELVTTPGVSEEFTPGGRNYRNFQLLREKGLCIMAPSQEALDIVATAGKETGDYDRLSSADREILALAVDISKDHAKEAVILTDDYSIQNVAHTLGLKFQSFMQKGIAKKFKWMYQCQGCGKKFKGNINTCPICGTETKNIISAKEDLD